MDPDARRETGRKYYGRYKDYFQRYYYEKKYGIAPEDVERLLNEQGGGCAICGSRRPGGGRGRGRRWHVDHDHVTDDLRGILCGHCNRGLGLFKDNPAFLQKAIEYLQKPPIKIKRAVLHLVK